MDKIAQIEQLLKELRAELAAEKKQCLHLQEEKEEGFFFTHFRCLSCGQIRSV